MAIPLRARIALTYDGHPVASGEVFLAQSESDARVLGLLGRAETIDAPPAHQAPAKRAYRRRDLTAEASPVRTKRTYRRRNLTAEHE